MMYDKSIDQKEINRCLLCESMECSKACPHGQNPGRVLRSCYFDNEKSSILQLKEGVCDSCDAPCEKNCVLPEYPIQIKKVLMNLGTYKKVMPHVEGYEEVDLSINMLGVKFENPFILSSSVVASNYEMISKAFKMGWAGACYKTICNFIPREVSPRFSSLKSREHQFYGFKNIEQLSQKSLEEDLAIIKQLKIDFPNKVIIVSIMGRNEEEWTMLAKRVTEVGADIIECNFSCPNMEQDGLGVDIGQSEELVAKYTLATRKGTNLPILAKMTPNITDMVPVAFAAIENGADGIAAINTIKSIINVSLDNFVSAPNVRGRSAIGGYSGNAVKPIALRFIADLAKSPKLKGIPISGMGGIETWRDALDFMFLGASTVQVTTAVMQYGYRIVDELIGGLKIYMIEKGFEHVSQMIGIGLNSVVDLDSLDRDTILLPKFIMERCVGCSRCALSCEDGGHQAITMQETSNGLRPVLNAKKCVGCHLCHEVCPIDAITEVKNRISIS